MKKLQNGPVPNVAPSKARGEVGEIATVLTIATLVVIGISSFISSQFLKNRQTIKSRAAQPCTSCNENDQCIYHPELDFRSGRMAPDAEQCTDTGCINDTQCQSNRTCKGNGEDCMREEDCCSGVGGQPSLTCNVSKKCEPKVNPADIPNCPTEFTSQNDCENKCGSRKCEAVTFKGGYIPGRDATIKDGTLIPNCWRCNTSSYCDFGDPRCVNEAGKPTPQITPKVSIDSNCWYDSSCVNPSSITSKACNFGKGVCKKDFNCCPSQLTPRPTSGTNVTPGQPTPVPTGKIARCDQGKINCGILGGKIITNGFSLSSDGYKVVIEAKRSGFVNEGWVTILNDFAGSDWLWAEAIIDSNYDVRARLKYGNVWADQKYQEVGVKAPSLPVGRTIDFVFDSPRITPTAGPTQTPPPTNAPNPTIPPVPTNNPLTTVLSITPGPNTCIDSFSGQSYSCPLARFDSSKNIWIFVNCGSSSGNNCSEISCFDRDRKQQIECIEGAGLNETWQDTATGLYNIEIINTSGKKITIKNIRQRGYQGGIASWWGSINPNDKLLPFQKKTYSPLWAYCFSILSGGRDGFVTYEVDGGTTNIIHFNLKNCEKRVVIDISS